MQETWPALSDRSVREAVSWDKCDDSLNYKSDGRPESFLEVSCLS